MKKKELRVIIQSQIEEIDKLNIRLINLENCYLERLDNVRFHTSAELEFANLKIKQLEKAIYDFEYELKATVE